jgi:D-hydantoinase
MVMRVDTLVAGGTVVTGSSRSICDIAVRNGLIVGLTDPALRPEADRYVDATGKLIIPGVIDAHTHHRTSRKDGDVFHDVTVCAAYGGVTTVLSFAQGELTQPLLSFLPQHIEEGKRAAATDFGLHGIVLPKANDVDQIPQAMQLGVNSFKVFMAYRPSGRMMTDDLMLKIFDMVGRHGGLMQVHCENGDVVDYLVEKLTREGHVDPTWYPKSQPDFIEVEGINRASVLAAVAGCPLYVVHISSPAALDAAVAARSKNGRVYTETLPKFLILDDSEMERQGPFAKIGPPLRPRSEVDRMLPRLQSNLFDVVASDHASHPPETKQPGYKNIFASPPSAPGTETLLPIMYGEFVATGKLRLEQLVRMMCEHPAQIFGLYPRKGSLSIGADADLVIIDPDVEWTVTHDSQHSIAGHTMYYDRKLRGKPVASFLRGEPLLQDGKLVRTDAGQYIARPVATTPALTVH